MSGSPPGDGPWHVSDRIEIAADGLAAPAAARRAALAEGLRRVGLAVVADDPGADLLLLDADTEVSPEAVLELRRIADRDPMIVAVMPRILAPGAADLPEAARPPDLAYAVLPERRCLFVKRSVLAALGERPAPGDRASRIAALNSFGFRVAIAGRALAHHPGGAPRPRVADAPPALRAALARDLSSAPAAADRLLDALAPGRDGRLAVAFDLSALTAGHSGTTRLAAALVAHVARRRPALAVHAIAGPAAFAAHLGGLDGTVTRVDPADPRVFAAAIRIGQPFLWGEMDAFAARAPVLVLFLLDTIGLDCLAHAPDELDALWRFVCAEADGLLFNSAFTERQFERRFAVRPGLPRCPSLHSLDLADYREGPAEGAGEGHGVLVVGNRFPHKYLRETVAALARADLGRPLTALGLDPGAVPGVASVPSGDLSPARLASLYAAAEVVVYPSLYEGFGFPILEALAHRRPILVRDLPPYREIAAGLPEAANLHLYADDADLVARLRDPPAWRDAEAVPVRTWDDAADDLLAVLDAALAGVDRARIVRRIDLLRGRLSYMRTLTLARPGDDALERLAGAAGRLAQGAVARLGRRVPARLLGVAARALHRRR